MDPKAIHYIRINTVLFILCGSQDDVLPSVMKEVLRLGNTL